MLTSYVMIKKKQVLFRIIRNRNEIDVNYFMTSIVSQTLESRPLIDAFLPILLWIIYWHFACKQKKNNQQQRQRQKKNVFSNWVIGNCVSKSTHIYNACVCISLNRRTKISIQHMYKWMLTKNLSIFDLSIYIY